MSNLSKLIDRLPYPEIPASLNPTDQQLVQMLIESARQQVRPYTGDYRSAWLLAPFEQDVWHTTNRGREELINGVWKNTIVLDWRTRLPNGCLLTDARYATLLTTLKKVSFLMRSDLICGMSTPKGWLEQTRQLIKLGRWLVLHEGLYQPETHGLSLIDQPALHWFFDEFARGKSAGLLQIPQRALAALYLGAHGKPCPPLLLNHCFALPSLEIEHIIRWIKNQGGYHKVSVGRHAGKAILRRSWLGRLIHEDTGSVQGTTMHCFCRQFEPDFSGMALYVSKFQVTEFPSHRTTLVDDETKGITEESLYKIVSVFSSVLDAHRHLPTLIPDPAGLSLQRAKNLALRFVRTGNHTPFMPINTGLAYLNTAMRFVHIYGDALVGLYLDVVTNCKGLGKEAISAQNSIIKRHAERWRVETGEQITTVLNITQFTGPRRMRHADFNRFRSHPTLDGALRVLIGSCIVCMAILKPSREEELTYLKRHCLRHDANGHWLNFHLGKSNVNGVEAWHETDRPIPVITAKAIHLLQRLGAGLCDIFGGASKQSDNLFFLPRMDGQDALNADHMLLNEHLNYFCDFVGLPPDSEGRRWYVRIHEMRKWFLLLLFWSGRFDVLDAARWIAGHTDASHIYAYIEKEFPGESLPQIEAQYSEERLRRLAQDQSGDEDGANGLYEKVLKHFNADSLTMIPDVEWTEYVRTLRESNAFHLEPHSIRDDNGLVVGINVSFVMREQS